MDTMTAPGCVHATLTIATTRATEFVDITDRLIAIVAAGGLRSGIVNIQSEHTTTAVVVNEHESSLLADFADALERAAPARRAYAHDASARAPGSDALEERPNGHAHCRALFLPTSVCLNVVGGEMRLGRWQRLFLVELDGPRQRAVSVTMVGGAG